MTAIPDKDPVADAIYAALESRQDKPRPHMGASLLGHSCDRWLWLNFRWAVIEKFSGRILRLFRRGQLEEDSIVQDLRAIGMHITNTGVAQSRVDLGCHVSGSIDGIIRSGVPRAEHKKHIAEFKTHSKKSFDELIKDGVQKSKPMHYVQMQIYMTGTDIDRALYVAICKDDDRIYSERVKLDKYCAKKFIERGHRLALDERMPPPLSTDPSWYECKMCAGHEFCFDTQRTKQVNCRTCAHVTPLKDSSWHCSRFDASPIPYEHQLTGCECHVLHPDLVPWQMHQTDSGMDAIFEINGVNVRNGEPDQFVFASSEILADPESCAAIVSGDTVLQQFRTKFDGRIINAA